MLLNVHLFTFIETELCHSQSFYHPKTIKYFCHDLLPNIFAHLTTNIFSTSPHSSISPFTVTAHVVEIAKLKDEIFDWGRRQFDVYHDSSWKYSVRKWSYVEFISHELTYFISFSSSHSCFWIPQLGPFAAWTRSSSSLVSLSVWLMLRTAFQI